MQVTTRSGAGRVLIAKLLVLAGICAAACTLVAVPSAEALKKHGPLTISPARPSDSQALNVSWRPAYDWPAKGLIYQFEIVTGDGNTCERSATRVITKLWSKGDVVRGTLRPIGGVWCPGVATVILRSAKNQGSDPKARTLALMRLLIRDDPATPPAGVGPSNGYSLGEPLGSPITVTVLDGSSATVKVAGRGDRSAGLSGTIRGFVPGRYRPGRDTQFELTKAAVDLGALAPDPACTPAPAPGTLVLDSASRSTMTSLHTGTVAISVAFAQDPLALTGCQGELPAKPRSLLLRGTLGRHGLARAELTGLLSGLRLSDGADAEVVVKLIVRLVVAT